MKGYIAKVGNKSMKAYSYRFFTSKAKARQWAELQVKEHSKLGIKQYYRVEPRTLIRCRNSWCNRLTTPDMPVCIRCEESG